MNQLREPRHWHITRWLREPGECAACDQIRTPEDDELPGARAEAEK